MRVGDGVGMGMNEVSLRLGSLQIEAGQYFPVTTVELVTTSLAKATCKDDGQHGTEG